MLSLNNKTADQATIIIRADAGGGHGAGAGSDPSVPAEGFEKFALRAKEEVGY